MRYLVLLIGVWLPALIIAGGAGKGKEPAHKPAKSCLKKYGQGAGEKRRHIAVDERRNEVREFELSPEEEAIRDAARAGASEDAPVATIPEDEEVEALGTCPADKPSAKAAPKNVSGAAAPASAQDYDKSLRDMVVKIRADAQEKKSVKPLEDLLGVFKRLLNMPLGDHLPILQKYVDILVEEISIMKEKLEYEQTIKFEQDLAKMFQDALDEANESKSVEPLKKLLRVYRGILKTDGLGETNLAIARDYSARVEDEISKMSAKE